MVKRRPKKLAVRIEKKKKTDQADGIVILEKRTDDGAEKEKLLLLRVGVACIMVIFFVAWIFNLKYQFKINSNNNSNKSAFNWEQTKAELDKAMGQVKEGLAQIKQAREQAQNTLPVPPELTAEQIELLKGKLMSEAASSTTATASSTIK